MSKARAHLAKVRKDLIAYKSDNVQARLTISICDDQGVPRAKDRFFVVTAKVGRQVQMGKTPDGKPAYQDRANPHPDFEAFNFETDEKGVVSPLGRQSVRVLIENPDIEDAYKVGCRCQKAPGQPTAPGRKPFCQTWDSETATRWNGKEFIQMACLGEECPLRKEPPMKDGKRQPAPAKTQFKLVARLDEDGFPQVLLTECTGSDVNLANFASLLEQVETKWETMCKVAGLDIPLSWYPVPIRMTIYPHSGDQTRSPRIDYTLDCDIRDVFMQRVEWHKRMSGYGEMILSSIRKPLELTAGQLITEEMDDLDAVEVLQLDPVTPPPQASVTSRFSPAPTQEEAPPVSAPVVTVEPERPAQATPARPDFTTGTDLRRQLTTAAQTGDIDTVAGLLEASLEKLAAKPAAGPALAKVWSDFAPAIHEAHPGLSNQLEVIGCPRPVVTEEAAFTDDLPPPATEEEPNPFASSAPPPEPAKPAQKVTALERVEEYGKQYLASDDRDAAFYLKKLIVEFVDFPADARARWEAIKRQKAGK